MIKSSMTPKIRLSIGDWNLFGHWCLIFGIYRTPSAHRVLIHLAGSSYHLMRLLAQVRPPPKAVRTIKSPF